MKIRQPLIKELQRKIEKTYALDTGITNIEQYIIGDKGYKEFYAKEKIRTVVKSHSGAKVLIRDTHEIPDIFSMVDRVAMLYNGVIQTEGTPEEIQNSKNRSF
jgi:ABC-type lipopolysaccharide export system ATPase subunit